MPPRRAAVTALVAALKDSRRDVRWMAAVAVEMSAPAPDPGVLGADSTAALTSALVTALSGQSAEVGSSAATALGNLGRKSPGPLLQTLVAALNGSPAAGVRAAAALALGEFRWGHDQTTLALLNALGKDERPVVRDACDTGLRRLKDSRDAKEERRSAAIVPALIEALTSQDFQVRYHAAAILGEIGTDARASVPALVRTLNAPLDPEKMRTAKGHPAGWDPVGQAALALGESRPQHQRRGRWSRR